MYRQAEIELADGESENASLMEAELSRRQQTSGLAYPWGAGGSYCHIAARAWLRIRGNRIWRVTRKRRHFHLMTHWLFQSTLARRTG